MEIAPADQIYDERFDHIKLESKRVVQDQNQKTADNTPKATPDRHIDIDPDTAHLTAFPLKLKNNFQKKISELKPMIKSKSKKSRQDKDTRVHTAKRLDRSRNKQWYNQQAPQAHDSSGHIKWNPVRTMFDPKSDDIVDVNFDQIPLNISPFLTLAMSPSIASTLICLRKQIHQQIKDRTSKKRGSDYKDSLNEPSERIRQPTPPAPLRP